MKKKVVCEVKTHLACNQSCVRKVSGKKKGDPVFHICIGCRAYLDRQGLKLKEV